MSETEATPPPAPEPAIDEAQLRYALEQLRSEENFPLALIAIKNTRGSLNPSATQATMPMMIGMAN